LKEITSLISKKLHSNYTSIGGLHRELQIEKEAQLNCE